MGHFAVFPVKAFLLCLLPIPTTRCGQLENISFESMQKYFTIITSQWMETEDEHNIFQLNWISVKG